MPTQHGSRRFFAYFDDAGREWYVDADESTYESTDLGFGQSVTPAVFSNPQARLRLSAQRPIEPRYILCQQFGANSDLVKNKVFVGSTTAPVWGGGINTVSIDGSDWVVTAKIGEKRFLPPAADTAQLDGDVDSNVTA